MCHFLIIAYFNLCFIIKYRVFFFFLLAKIPQSNCVFSAHDLSASPRSTGSTLVFNKTLVNEDGVYSSTTGKFTAPCDGLYVFHATLSPGSPNTVLRVEFKAGEISLGRFSVYDFSNYVSSSGSAIGRLLKGTQVYMRVTEFTTGFTFWDDSVRFMSTFSGHLISK